MIGNPKDKIYELQQERQKFQYIVDLEGNIGWQEIVKLYTEIQNQLDSTWQDISDEKAMQEARVSKLAVVQILKVIQSAKEAIEQINQEIEELDNPDKYQTKDIE